MTVELGKRYRDKVHGTEGVATMRTEFLTACARVTLEYQKDGEVKSNSFDEPMLDLVLDAAPAPPPAAGSKPGGPGDGAPSAHSTVGRSATPSR